MTIWCFSFELFWKSNCVLYSVWTDFRVGRLTTDHCKHTKKPNSHKWGNLCLYYIPLWQMTPQGKKHLPSNSGKGKQQWMMDSGSQEYKPSCLGSLCLDFIFYFILLFHFYCGFQGSAQAVKCAQQVLLAHWAISPAISLHFYDSFLIGSFSF